jgi:hypothetical protein
MNKPAVFKLNEESQMDFKLSIKGSGNLPDGKQIMRFVINEELEDKIGVSLPAHPNENGVSVVIPPLKNIFVANKKYVGKLEIIIGNKYFNPLSMEVQFTEPEEETEIKVDEVILPEMEEEVEESKKKESKDSLQEISDELFKSFEKEVPVAKKEQKVPVEAPAYKAELKEMLKNMLSQPTRPPFSSRKARK